MSLVRQKQLLLKDYHGVCGPEGKKGKYTDGVIRPHRVVKKKNSQEVESNLSHVCL